MIKEIAEKHGIVLEDMDSLALMQLVLAVESELGISFSMSQIVSMKSVSAIEEAANECLKNKSQRS